MPPSTDRKLPNLALAILAVGLSLAVAEVGLRTIRPVLPSIYAPDSVVLHRYVPGARKLFRRSQINGGEEITVAINSLGFRGQEVPPHKPGARILVYGDSFIAAEFSLLDSTFAGQLGYMGMNEHGVGHFANALGNAAWQPGLSHYPLKRRCFEMFSGCVPRSSSPGVQVASSTKTPIKARARAGESDWRIHSPMKPVGSSGIA